MDGTLILDDLATTDSPESIFTTELHAGHGRQSEYGPYKSDLHGSDDSTPRPVDHIPGAVCEPMLAGRHETKELCNETPSNKCHFDLFQVAANRRWRWLERLALRSRFGYQPNPASILTRLLSNLAVWKFHSHLHQRDWIPFRAPGRLLNIGQCNVTFTERMRCFGWTVTDVDAPACHTSDHQEADVNLNSTQSQLTMPVESFDAVTLWHVLQRHSDPSQLLRSAAQFLRPGGLLVFEVPNVDSLTYSEFGEHWPAQNLMRYHFSPKTAKATLPLDLVRIVEMQQIGINSWILESARRAVAAGRTCYESWLSRGQSFWDEKALRSEIAHQADGLRIIAERRS